MDEEEFARALLSHERREWQDPEKIISQLNLRSGMVVVDLGCGPGFFTVPIARKVGVGGLVYGVYSSAMMLNYLRTNISRSKIASKLIKIVEADVMESGLDSHIADVVLFANILHDIEDKSRFGAEVRRILKAGGIGVDIAGNDIETPLGPPKEIRLPDKKATKILERGGWIVKKKIEAGPYHYGLVCLSP